MDALERRRQQQRETARRFVERHRDDPAYWRRRRASARASYARNGRAWELRENYGITVAEYDALLAAQGGGCAICGATTPGGRGQHFHVDHDHETGRVRGLLCHHCNTSLHRLEVAGWIEKAVAYLKG